MVVVSDDLSDAAGYSQRPGGVVGCIRRSVPISERLHNHHAADRFFLFRGVPTLPAHTAPRARARRRPIRRARIAPRAPALRPRTRPGRSVRRAPARPRWRRRAPIFLAGSDLRRGGGGRPRRHIQRAGASAPTTDPAGRYSAAGASAPTLAALAVRRQRPPRGGARPRRRVQSGGRERGRRAGLAARARSPQARTRSMLHGAPCRILPTARRHCLHQDPPGTFSPAGATAPTADPGGTYSAAGASAPTTDPAGTYSSPYALNRLFLVWQNTTPENAVLSFNSATAVANYYGATSSEASLANEFFAGYADTSATMLFTRYGT